MSQQVRDIDGSDVETINLVAQAARTQGDIVRIATGGTEGALDDATIADDTNIYRVAVALQDAASGAVYRAAWRGTVNATVPSGTYTAGNGLHVLNGAVADSGAASEAWNGTNTQNDFAIVQTGGTTVTTVVATLYGDPITAQT